MGELVKFGPRPKRPKAKKPDTEPDIAAPAELSNWACGECDGEEFWLYNDSAVICATCRCLIEDVRAVEWDPEKEWDPDDDDDEDKDDREDEEEIYVPGEIIIGWVP